jgi:MFS family permease
LYFQEVRGFDVFKTGMLAAAHGVGLCVMLPWSGRLADRFGSGRVATVGCVAATLATIPLALLSAHTPLVLVELALFARGLGVGAVVIPVTVAVYGSLRQQQMGDAAAQLNVLQRVGGSLGTALMAVVLTREIASLGVAPSHAALATAFDTAFWWLLALTACTIVPCLSLLAAERRRASAAPIEVEAAPVSASTEVA